MSEEKDAVKEMQEHFAPGSEKINPPAEKINPPGPEAVEDVVVDDLGANLDFTELCPELLEQYLKTKERVKVLKAHEDRLRQQILDHAPQGSLKESGRVAVTKGAFVVTLSRRSQVTVDWSQYVKDALGEPALREIEDQKKQVRDGKLDVSCMKRTESIVVEVTRAEEVDEY